MSPPKHHAIRRIGILMAVEAASLGIVGTLHLSGHVHGRGKPFDADHAGIAEIMLCVVLAIGSASLLTHSRYLTLIACAANTIAIIGFLVGLNMTARGGDWPDISYHLVTLPCLSSVRRCCGENAGAE